MGGAKKEVDMLKTNGGRHMRHIWAHVYKLIQPTSVAIPSVIKFFVQAYHCNIMLCHICYAKTRSEILNTLGSTNRTIGIDIQYASKNVSTIVQYNKVRICQNGHKQNGDCTCALIISFCSVSFFR